MTNDFFYPMIVITPSLFFRCSLLQFFIRIKVIQNNKSIMDLSNKKRKHGAETETDSSTSTSTTHSDE